MQTNITEKEAVDIVGAAYALEQRLKTRAGVRMSIKIVNDKESYDKTHICFSKSPGGEFWEHEWQKGDTVESFLASLEARAKISTLFESL